MPANVLQSPRMLLSSRQKSLTLQQLWVANLVRLWHSWELTIHLIPKTTLGSKWASEAGGRFHPGAGSFLSFTKIYSSVMVPCSSINPSYVMEGEGRGLRMGVDLRSQWNHKFSLNREKVRKMPSLRRTDLSPFEPCSWKGKTSPSSHFPCHPAYGATQLSSTEDYQWRTAPIC